MVNCVHRRHYGNRHTCIRRLDLIGRSKPSPLFAGLRRHRDRRERHRLGTAGAVRPRAGLLLFGGAGRGMLIHRLMPALAAVGECGSSRRNAR